MKRWHILKKALVTAILLLFSVFTMAVCAEEGGYWTTCTDSEGRVTRVFTYTEPVEYTLAEGTLDESAEPLGECVHDAEVVSAQLAAPAGQDMVVFAAAPASSNPLAGVAVLGVVMLAVLAAALYKAV